MGERKWTEQQKSAIYVNGGSLLVSAAAGSGKTAVLVRRVIEKITSPDLEIHCDADRLLIVTFTRAAAAEMKERITAELQQRLAENPMDLQLRRQISLIKKAHISTIHSFCSRLIRDNFYRLNISSDFRVADESEIKILREECISETLEKYYSAGNEDFLRLAEQIVSDKDDRDLKELVKSLEYYVNSYPFPDLAMARLGKAYDATSPEDTIWAKATFDYVKSALDYALEYNRLSRNIASSDDVLADKYLPAFEQDGAALERISSAVEARDWDALCSLCASVSAAPLGRARKLPPQAGTAKTAREMVKNALEDISKAVVSDRETFEREIKFTGDMVAVLILILRDYLECLSERKNRRRILDFSDLEHYSVRLLTERKPECGDEVFSLSGKDYAAAFQKTDIALAVTDSFDEILVDEYQDVNAVQTLIFSAIARNAPDVGERELTDGVNVIMVGDMKQSIYRFRRAVPELFMDKFKSYTPYRAENTEFPALVTLDANFRSRREVTECVNFVFGGLMSEEVGGVSYEGSQELKARAVYPDSDEMAAEMHFLYQGEGDNASSYESEAEYIAAMIKDMLDGGFKVTDSSTGELRPAEYRDFCILRRSMSNKGRAYSDALERRGIPAWISSDGGLLETDESNVILSFLKIINNPLLDIPLMCVMMSPIYAFSPDELAEIRLKDRTAPLYTATTMAARDGNQKCMDFLKSLEHFRAVAAVQSADKLIEEIYYSTGYMAAVSSMSDGELRLSGLRLLREFAASGDKSGGMSAAAFVSLTDRMLEQGEDLPGASSVTENADVVRIMTVHKSKGLEFPICVVAGLGAQFNRDDDVGGVMLHNDLFLGMKMKENGVYYETQLRRSIINQAYLESLSEEMRVLYVALTRAREKLIMVALPRSLKSCAVKASMTARCGRISPFALFQSGSFAAWLMMAAVKHPSARALREYADIEADVSDCGVPLKITVQPTRASSDSPENGAGASAAGEEHPCPNECTMEEIERRLEYEYPYRFLENVPSKVTASELTEKQQSEPSLSLVRPAFLMKKGLTPTERGKALHKYMQLANFRVAASDPEAELDRLLNMHFLTETEAGAVDVSKVRRFFDVTAPLLKNAEEIMCEHEFSVKLPKEYMSLVTDENVPDGAVVLEGECDCVLVYGSECVIIDYKTDRINDPQKLVEHYATQLLLYKYAIQITMDKPVTGIYIYSFYLDRLIEVKQES